MAKVSFCVGVMILVAYITFDPAIILSVWKIMWAMFLAFAGGFSSRAGLKMFDWSVRKIKVYVQKRK